MSVIELLKEKRDSILSIAQKYGANNVRIFGSVARNKAVKESDIDLLVSMEPGRSYLDLVALWQELEELLGCKVDLITDGGISPYLRDQILEEAIPL